MQLDNELRNLVMGDLSVHAYCAKIKGIADLLANLDPASAVPDKHLVIYTINGLSSRFDFMANIIRYRSLLPTFLEVRSMLLMEEQRMENHRCPHSVSCGPLLLVHLAQREHAPWTWSSPRSSTAVTSLLITFLACSASLWLDLHPAAHLQPRHPVETVPERPTVVVAATARPAQSIAGCYVFCSQPTTAVAYLRSPPVAHFSATLDSSHAPPTWVSPDQATSLLELFNSMTQDPGAADRYMDTGATDHVHANSGLQDSPPSHPL